MFCLVGSLFAVTDSSVGEALLAARQKGKQRRDFVIAATERKLEEVSDDEEPAVQDCVGTIIVDQKGLGFKSTAVENIKFKYPSDVTVAAVCRK